MLAGASLAALPLQALAGVAAPEIAAREATSAGAFEILFAAASRGGAYGTGLGGAYGRLAAWQSLAGLTGAAAPDTGAGPGAGLPGIDSVAGIGVRRPPPAQPGTSSSAPDPAGTAKSPGTSASRPCGLMAAPSRS